MLLKEGLPHSLFADLTDDKVLTYYHIILFIKQKEADAAAAAQQR